MSEGNSPKYKRIFLVVLDGVGIGALPDADQYNDVGAHTLKHVSEAVGGLKLSVLKEFGLGSLDEIMGVAPVDRPKAFFAKMRERSRGKDTTTGHWEMVGLVVNRPFATFPEGFPPELMKKFLEATGCQGFVGNKPASGTEIIQELGEEHRTTGFPIIYTSADSVFQVAAHEDVIPRTRLYQICEIARRVCDEWNIARVIARPFKGKEKGKFERTAYRRDFSVTPPSGSLLEGSIRKGIHTVSIGKIYDIFAGGGFSQVINAKGNQESMEALLRVTHERREGIIFANLVDFDMLYGHRNDAKGYAKALEEFDRFLPEFLTLLSPQDLLMITADHGCDPTYPGTDHTREYVPLLVYSPALKVGKSLGVRESFADVGQTVAENFELPPLRFGQSFLAELS